MCCMNRMMRECPEIVESGWTLYDLCHYKASLWGMQPNYLKFLCSGPQDYKTFFMLASHEHEIYPNDKF